MYEVFNTGYDSSFVGHDGATPRWPDAGRIETDDNGNFVIGPFTASSPDDPGYWFVAAESWQDATPASATPGYETVGDVVFWYEYPDIKFGVNELNNLPIQPNQYATPPSWWLESSTVNSFPVTYDDATPLDEATPSDINWEPPKWYAIQKYKQYQMGLMGSNPYEIDFANLDDLHPDHRDF